MSTPRNIKLTFNRDEAEGLADLLAQQFGDAGFVKLSEEIYAHFEDSDAFEGEKP